MNDKGRSIILAKLGIKAIRSRTFRDSDMFMDEFIETLTNLGGVYAKFLQGVLLGYSVRKKVRAEDFKHLEIFEDNPDPKLSEQTIRIALGNASDYIRIISLKPLGVGSYSAVYPAELADGTPLIIKILRPNVRSEIVRDLRFLKKLSFILKIASFEKLPMDISQLYGSFKKACIKETDFEGEISFATELYERYKSHPYIVIPKTYRELCSENIIVQERIEGLSLKDVVAKHLNNIKANDYVKEKTGSDLMQLLRVLYYDMLIALLSGSSFHGDLHPGNIRILPNDKIGLLDFGIKALPYNEKVVPAFINKLISDTKFMHGDFDVVRTLDAHFRLYMSNLYDSVESLFHYAKKDISDFFSELVKVLNINPDSMPESNKFKWLERGPVFMLNDMLGNVKNIGMEVRISDQTAHRAVNTIMNLFISLGIKRSDIYTTVYPKVIEKIEKERPELFAKKKYLQPDIAIENIYAWLEKLSSTNPDLSYKLRTYVSTSSRRFAD